MAAHLVVRLRNNRHDPARHGELLSSLGCKNACVALPSTAEAAWMQQCATGNSFSGTFKITDRRRKRRTCGGANSFALLSHGSPFRSADEYSSGLLGLLFPALLVGTRSCRHCRPQTQASMRRGHALQALGCAGDSLAPPRRMGRGAKRAEPFHAPNPHPAVVWLRWWSLLF